jgi:hypothetical protein
LILQEEEYSTKHSNEEGSCIEQITCFLCEEEYSTPNNKQQQQPQPQPQQQQHSNKSNKHWTRSCLKQTELELKHRRDAFDLQRKKG